MSRNLHHYRVQTHWTGADAGGTADYASYSRDIQVAIAGKLALPLSADPAFRGDPGRHNPEELFLAAVSSCHLLFYLALCARNGVRVLAYRDDAQAQLILHADGGGAFSAITLQPQVTIADPGQLALAHELHARAAQLCFIARSCAVPITHHARIDCAADQP